ncbi:hypothetical protein [Mycobacterium rhizamassiliense]|uniref:hypothetical protein n=1 Tax=Mycobacterium rhizamassiliense TaxID=1841860 RepID=UPI00097CF1C2|nr:hypothetical protein [Mycobacterium rhizamassiliense]
MTSFLDEARWSNMRHYSLSMPLVIDFPARHPKMAEIAERDRVISRWRSWMGTPPELTVVPFSAAENRGLMERQAWEPFWTYSACPGCGNIDAHLIRQPDECEPEWATVVRQCAVCAREGVQS